MASEENNDYTNHANYFPHADKETNQVAGGLHKGAEHLESPQVDRRIHPISTHALTSPRVAFGMSFVLARLLPLGTNYIEMASE